MVPFCLRVPNLRRFRRQAVRCVGIQSLPNYELESSGKIGITVVVG